MGWAEVPKVVESQWAGGVNGAGRDAVSKWWLSGRWVAAMNVVSVVSLCMCVSEEV